VEGCERREYVLVELVSEGVGEVAVCGLEGQHVDVRPASGNEDSQQAPEEAQLRCCVRIGEVSEQGEGRTDDEDGWGNDTR
jgi:hypothetical protein